jgi:hypothetical protein
MKQTYDIFHVLLPTGEYRNVYGLPVEQDGKVIGAIENSDRIWTVTQFEAAGFEDKGWPVYRFISSYSFRSKRDALASIFTQKEWR